jgi:hypothetical protein
MALPSLFKSLIQEFTKQGDGDNEWVCFEQLHISSPKVDLLSGIREAHLLRMAAWKHFNLDELVNSAGLKRPPMIKPDRPIPDLFHTGELPEEFRMHDFDTLISPLRLLLIQRAFGKARHMVNIADVKNALQRDPRYNVSVIDFDYTTPRFQVETFSDADVVVAVHGAALTNIIFMKPGSALVEILPYKASPFFFMRIAKRLSISYFPILNEGVNGTAVFKGNNRTDEDLAKCDNVASVDVSALAGTGCNSLFRNAPITVNIGKLMNTLSSVYDLVTRRDYAHG